MLAQPCSITGTVKLPSSPWGGALPGSLCSSSRWDSAGLPPAVGEAGWFLLPEGRGQSGHIPERRGRAGSGSGPGRWAEEVSPVPGKRGVALSFAGGCS